MHSFLMNNFRNLLIMDSPVATSRQPIENLKLDESKESKIIIEKFDMFREITTSMMRDALSFGYLEHLFRVSTPLNETIDSIRLYPRNIQGKLMKLAQMRDEVLQEALHSLDSLITREDLKYVKINLININYK